MPGSLVDRGRAALSGAGSARASVSALGRRVRAPGGLLGPVAPAVGVPAAPDDVLVRDVGEVARLLPRSVVLSTSLVRGDVGTLGWTGRMYGVGAPESVALVRVVPPPRESRASSAARLAVDLAVDTLANSYGGDDDPAPVELIGTDGQVLLRSTPARRRRGDRTIRDVSLADGTVIAHVVAPAGTHGPWEVVPVVGAAAEPIRADPQVLHPSRPSAARAWRGSRELASVRTEGKERLLTLGDPRSDDEALLVWSAALSWWSGTV
ncbi:hypothetical protein CLV28_0528 [Sediminihabitans luteus]|uniref:Uncharacterized protein n=1 Tax=Sediminihabitans luteus TaxID=1138585 RepID=A0A2M9CZG0_9CELL|nr:hypothetical protein [Sediminihabitans luteus]PJJ77309.1 hypothetical protein CLV28_0528 [Sediminihabitans luteus]GII98760.1 hypothetical protein Slu03_11380 [Sediminihabitans luteus]